MHCYDSCPQADRPRPRLTFPCSSSKLHHMKQSSRDHRNRTVAVINHMLKLEFRLGSECGGIDGGGLRPAETGAGAR